MRQGVRGSLFIMALAAGIGVLLALGPMRGSGSASGGQKSAVSAPDDMDNSGVVADFGLIGMNRLVNESDAAVVGTITNVAAPRWNSADGRRWTRSGNEPIPLKYRDVTINVTDVIFSDAAASVSSNSHLIIRARGDGTATGNLVDGPGIEGLRYNEICGSLAVGDQGIFVVVRDTFGMREGFVSEIVLMNSYQGHWRLHNQTAESLDPMRTVPSAPLLQRIRDERRQGRNANLTTSQEDQTRHSPLNGAAGAS